MTTRSVLPGAFVAVLAIAMALGGCGGSNSGSDDPGGPAQRYEVEGILAQLPDGPGRELMIRHVPIPTFVNASGDTVGMNAMTMGFPVSDPAVLRGFEAGDSVRFVFEVRWGTNAPLRITEIERLPPGSTIDFGDR